MFERKCNAHNFNGSSLAFLLLAVALLAGCAPIYDFFGGSFRGQPWELHNNLSPGAQQLVDDAFADIDPDALGDMHVHLISRDVDPDWISFRRPALYWRSQVYLSGAGVRWSENIEQEYLDRLIALIEGFPIPGKFYLYALDRYWLPDGTPGDGGSPIHVSNEFMWEVFQARPDIFVPVMSVSPHRADAIEQLNRWADKGVRHVKWIPNSMGINPADPRVVPFYEVMRDRDLVLLTHTGAQESIRVINQGLGNPLLLRLPLDMGVKVVALHSASDSTDIDLDHPSRPRVSSFDLFMRLMDEQRYEGLLFGETSTLTFFTHLDEPLLALLERPDLHRRFVNGSDYPLCALDIVIQTRQLARLGFLTREEARQLDEVYNFNPLLFDFLVKRTVRHPDTGRRLSPELFHVPPELR